MVARDLPRRTLTDRLEPRLKGVTAITAAALNFFGRLVAPRAPPSAHGEKNSRVAEASAAAV